MTEKHSSDSVDMTPPRMRLQESWVTIAWRELKRAPLSAKIGIIIILSYVLTAIFAPVIAPYGESELIGGVEESWSDFPPFGTDHLGRDVFSRLIYGARNTVGIALITTVVAFFVGGVLGILAAIVGGWVDQILSRIVDVFMAIPLLIFAMLLLTIFGRSIINLILIIGLLDATRVFRLARAISLNVVVMDFIEAAKLRGEGLGWVAVKEVLPNIMPPLIAEFGLRFCFVFLTISALSFLGLGIQPPTADWGSMVKASANLINWGEIAPLLPAAAIAILTIGVNFVVDWFLHKSSGIKDEH